MTSGEAWGEELRVLVREAITELRESLRADNAESVTRGQQMMEGWVGDRLNRRDSANDVWARLGNDPTVFVQGDYGLLRTGLGRRVSPDGPPIDLALQFEVLERGLLVRGKQLKRSIGLVVRWTDEDEYGPEHEQVIPHAGGDDTHTIPYGQDFGDSPLRVISFDATSVTGFGVWSAPMFSDSALTSE